MDANGRSKSVLYKLWINLLRFLHYRTIEACNVFLLRTFQITCSLHVSIPCDFQAVSTTVLLFQDILQNTGWHHVVNLRIAIWLFSLKEKPRREEETIWRLTTNGSGNCTHQIFFLIWTNKLSFLSLCKKLFRKRQRFLSRTLQNINLKIIPRNDLSPNKTTGSYLPKLTH